MIVLPMGRGRAATRLALPSGEERMRSQFLPALAPVTYGCVWQGRAYGCYTGACQRPGGCVRRLRPSARGGVAERIMATDCKSVTLTRYTGSNPVPSTNLIPLCPTTRLLNGAAWGIPAIGPRSDALLIAGPLVGPEAPQIRSTVPAAVHWLSQYVRMVIVPPGRLAYYTRGPVFGLCDRGACAGRETAVS